MRLLTRSHWLLAAACIALAGCGENKTELGQGGSVVTGSAGPQGAQNAARELVRCDAPVATLALAENPNGYIMGSGYQLPSSPVPLVKLLAQQSGCFRVVDRAAGRVPVGRVHRAVAARRRGRIAVRQQRRRPGCHRGGGVGRRGDDHPHDG